MRFDHQRRLAASILKCGLNRVRITTDPAEQENILDAITREQLRQLIRRNVITMRPVRGVSRGRTRKRQAQRAKGRRRGHGTRKGSSSARTPDKQRWMSSIRSLRTHLRDLKSKGRIDVRTYRSYYRKAKGGMFKSRAHLEQQLRAAGLLKEGAT
ncbi:MAG: 50S ribosomal protein L19e [Euryarchaeota archaeon RBG_16_68_13]|nr:MAG: 50S ribosomal protein L19e [Euryarchaeota archaeon RBG_16_68_13]